MATNSEQSTDTYSTDPNQIVYDEKEQVDFEVELISVYFAEQKPKLIWEAKTEVYSVKSGGTPANVKARFVNKKRRNISTDLEDDVKLVAGQQVTVRWEEEVQEKGPDGKGKFIYFKLPKGKIKGKVLIVASCNGTNGKLSIEIHENKLTNEELIFTNPVKFLIGDVEKTKVEFTINNTFIYAQEISLRPKADVDLKSILEKLEKREDKNAFLYFKANITDTEDQIKYFNNSNEFLNEKDTHFEVKNCDCGEKYKDLIECTRYNKAFGPVYWGELPLKDYDKWDELTAGNTVSADEKSILIAMSENEGKMDAVQSYDSEILTAGAMQKTINATGYGELPIQIWEFKTEFPDKYKCYLESCKWEIVEEKTEHKNSAGVVTKTTYKYKAKYDGLEGKDLKNKIREGFEESKYNKKVVCPPMEPIISLMKDNDYKVKQIKDFIKRLNSALAKKPTGYSYPISSYITSNLGKATVLDNDVNRPGHVANCFGAALDSFFTKNSKVSKNPSEWGVNFSTYEGQILEIYGPLRGEGSYTMTNATKRYTDLKSKL
ncbi:hypothetical protein ACFSX9_01385 [Flavobacterium ardleyense]|uniref:Uncharacterized protein n=1 Tax=Flavobacterium ardleyense TaxID=2038737 RepID=A0ABW5Z3H3_9FLAO